MPSGWIPYPTRRWDWCRQEDNKKIEPFFIYKNEYKVTNIVQLLKGAFT